MDYSQTAAQEASRTEATGAVSGSGPSEPAYGLAEPSLAPLTSFLPALLLRRLQGSAGTPLEPQEARILGVVLVADIAGFTTRTERLAEEGPEGAETVAETLNACLGRVLTVIAAHGGEVLHFAGDAAVA